MVLLVVMVVLVVPTSAQLIHVEVGTVVSYGVLEAPADLVYWYG